MALTPGTRLGPYEVVAPLGAGGMGEVYRAHDRRLGRDVALKILPAALSRDADALARFEVEARAAAALSHPNVRSLFDVGESEGIRYAAAELLVGDTLRARLATGALPMRKALEVAAQVAEGLAAGHAKGIVHRDIKPENVFLTDDGLVKILDFGLARIETKSASQADASLAPTTPVATQPGTVLGTAGYMSPEQVLGRPADARSDIFSFGCLLYEMLTGARAFKRDSTVETLNAILKEEPQPLTSFGGGFPPGVESVIRHCLEKAPEDRFQSTRDLAFNLRALSSASAVTAPTIFGPARRRRLPRPVLITAGAALALAVAAGLGFRLGRLAGGAGSPTFQQLTFRRGLVQSARFAPEGHTILYGAMWERNPVELFATRPDAPESRSLGFPPADILSISRKGRMALVLVDQAPGFNGSKRVLAEAPLEGGVPREVLEDVVHADWGPDGTSLAVIRGSRLEYPVGKPLYESPGWLTDVRVAPDGKAIAFVEHPVPGEDSGSVLLLDLARGGKPRVLSTGWLSIQGLAFSPAGSEVWFTASDRGSASALWAVSRFGNTRLLLRVPGRLQLEDVRRDGRVLLQRQIGRNGMVALAPGETEERDVSWLDWSHARDLSADGTMVLFDEAGEGGGQSHGVFLRRTDCSPAVRLGDGLAKALSPDGKWALTVPKAPPPQQLVLLPTSAGTPRAVTNDSIDHQWAAFFPDGRRVLFAGREPGKGVRLYAQSVEGGPPRAITPEGYRRGAVSPDGRTVAAAARDGRLQLFASDGAGEPRPVPGEGGLVPTRFTSDGRALFARQLGGALPQKVFRLDLASGQRTLWKSISPEPAGLWMVQELIPTPDGRAYVYSYLRILSDLYLVTGIR